MTEQLPDMTKVLVIDSVSENIKFLTTDLENDGYRVYSATKGKEGISLAQQNQPDVILLDLMTEDIFGFEICRALNNHQSTMDIPVIIISAREDIDDIIEALDIGAMDFIAKPFHYPIAAARIRSAIRIKKSQDKIKATNKALEIAREQALSSEKTKAIFLANMSHEIRTPLNGIIGMSSLLEETNLDAEQREFVETINSSSDLLMELVNNILDYTKFESKKMTIELIQFDLSEIIDEVHKVISSSFDNNKIQLIKDYDKKLPNEFIGCPTRLRQVLLNLLSNAVKFSEQGDIIAKVKLLSHSGKQNLIRIEIIDSGVGIEQEKLNRLFKPFSQIDESTTRLYGGSGLGLAICRETIELMEGKIGVQSELGKGSTFWFELTLDDARDSIPLQLQDTDIIINPKQLLEGKHLLLVEDNVTNQMLAKALIKPTAADVDIAENGKIAVDKFQNNDYDIILMDCQMPVMDGYEATKHIRNKDNANHDIIIIGVTANAMKTDREKCLSVGMNDYLSKPYNKNDFYKLLHYWLIVNRQNELN